MTGTPLVLDEMLYFIEQAMTSPRSLQKHIGPSELGAECERKLGHRLAGTEKVNHRSSLAALEGTWCHAGITEVFNAANGLWPEEEARWLTDLEVAVGVIDGVSITGHLDLYDAGSTTVIDFKFPGERSMRERRAHGPGQQYRIQLHLYAAGAIAMGLPVSEVGLLALPAGGDLAEVWYWSEPYDPELAAAYIARADVLARTIRTIGPQVLSALATAPDHCLHCAYYLPRVAASALSCPGDSSLSNRAASAPALVFVP